MSSFGENLFARTPFLFWALAPVLLLGALAITFPIDRDPLGPVVTLACDVAALLLVPSLWPYHRVPCVIGLPCLWFAVDALGPDHFLEFQLHDGRTFAIPFGWRGAGALSEHVRRLRDTRFTERGSLASVIGSDSIVVWPAAEAGRPLA